MKLTRFFSTILLLSLAFAPFAQAEYLFKSIKKTEAGEIPIYVIRQKDLPALIEEPGEYVVENDLFYDGFEVAAITIVSDNVKLNFNNHDLVLSDPRATGIRLENVSEVTIENDAIININEDSQEGYGIYIVDADKITIKNVVVVNHYIGLIAAEILTLNVTDSQFYTPEYAGAALGLTANVTFDNCSFVRSDSYGLVFSVDNVDVRVLNSDFLSSDLTDLLVQQVYGMTVENCSFNNTDGNDLKRNLVQFGDTSNVDQLASDVIFKNNTIVNRLGDNTNPEGLGLYNVSGVLVDSCIIDIDNTDTDPDLDLSAIHIGDGSGDFVGSDVIIRNTIVNGPAMNGIYADIGSTNIFINESLVSNAIKNGIFLAGTSASVVLFSTITNNGTNGIFIGEGSTGNDILKSIITANGFDVVASTAPTGNGIGLAVDSSLNLIKENDIFLNNANLVDLGTNNNPVDNTIF